MTKQYVQYSKKLTTTIVVFWIVARLLSFILTAIRPEIGHLIIELLKGLDQITTINVLAYTSNSIGQKVATSYFKYKSKSSDDDEQETKETQNG